MPALRLPCPDHGLIWIINVRQCEPNQLNTQLSVINLLVNHLVANNRGRSSTNQSRKYIYKNCRPVLDAVLRDSKTKTHPPPIIFK